MITFELRKLLLLLIVIGTIDLFIGLIDLNFTIKPKYIHLIHEVETKTNLPSKYIGKFTFTHYCPCPKCTGKPLGSKLITATGTTPRQGRTVAVDPKVIPLGSIIYIESIGYFVAEDTGGAIKGNKIDIFVNNHEEATRLGTLGGKKLKVFILRRN